MEIVVNGVPVQVQPENASQPLLDFLRTVAHVKSAKLACGEGGCGACAVLVQSKDDTQPGGVKTRSINACLAPVFTVDGCSVTTAEGLPKNVDGVNPVAERLAGFHASQCGFCTPGMAVACAAALSKAAATGTKPTSEDMRNALDGNLCRCTGYRPIIDACKSFACDVDMEDLGANIFTCNSKALPCAPTNMLGTDQLPMKHTDRSADTTTISPKVIKVGAGQTLYVPHTVDQLVEVVSKLQPDGYRLVCGNTGPGVYKNWPVENNLVLTTKVQEFRRSEVDTDGTFKIGSAITLSELIDVFEAEAKKANASSGHPYLEMAAHLSRVAGHHVRNAGSVVGNLVLSRTVGLPSDVATLMAAADASLEVMIIDKAAAQQASQADKGCKTVQVPVLDWVCKSADLGGVSDQQLLVTAAKLPTPQVGCKYWSTRVATRYANAASTINAAAMLPPTVVAGNAGSRFVVGMNLNPTHGPEQWKVFRCSKVEQLLDSSDNTPGNAQAFSDLAGQALPAMQADVDCILSSATSPVAAAADAHNHVSTSEREEHFEYLRSTAQGIALQALAALFAGSTAQINAHPINTAGSVSSVAADDSVSTGDAGSVASDASAGDNGHGMNHQQLTNPSRACVAQEPAGEMVVTENTPDDGNDDGRNGSIKACTHHNTTTTTTACSNNKGAVKECSGRCQGGSRALPAKLVGPGVVQGSQDLPTPDAQYAPITQALPKESAVLQAQGTARYSDDVPVIDGALYATWVTSTAACGKVLNIDKAAALKVPGAVQFIGPQDVPAPYASPFDEPVFGTDVQYYGQPIGLMLGSSPQAALHAAKAIQVEYDKTQEPVLDTAVALEKASTYNMGMFVRSAAPGKRQGSIQAGDTEALSKVAASPLKLQDVKVHIPSQGHMYMEPQTAVAEVEEGGCVRVHVSTQNLDSVQMKVAQALKLLHNQVEVRCRRLGGGFGGKAVNADRVATAAAVAAKVTGRQVRLATNRNQDMAMIGGRCDTDVTFSVGFDEEGHIQALDMDIVMQAGGYMNIAWIDVMGMMSTVDNVYHIPSISTTYTLLRMNLAPRNAVRGPGDFQGVIAMEHVIEAVAQATRLDPGLVRERNMRQPQPDTSFITTSFGKKLSAVDQYSLPRIWKELKESSQYQARLQQVEDFNSSSPWVKRGLSIVPCMYPLPAFTKTAIVHLYVDGSVLVCHPGMDMGQGLGVKVLQTAAYELSKLVPESQRPIPMNLIRPADPSTFSLPHNSMTAATTTCDAACAAVRAACAELVKRLQPLTAALGPDYTWHQLLAKTAPMPGFKPIIDLTAAAEGSLLSDLISPLGEPMRAYTAYGACVAEAEIDVLTGDRRIKSVEILFDCGRSVNPAVDLGQVEGAFTFGMGLMLSETVEADPSTGACTTNSTWSYKIPSALCVPEKLHVAMLKDSPLSFKGPLSAKGVGEPPLLLSCGVLFALAAAARAARAQYTAAPAANNTVTAAEGGAGLAAPKVVVLPMPATPKAIKKAVGPLPLQQLVKQVAA